MFRIWKAVALEFEAVKVDIHVLKGEPTLRGTTITVSQIQQLAAAGLSASEIAAEFEGAVTIEDVRDAFRFAARLVSRA